MTTVLKKSKSNRKNQNATIVIKTIIDNTKEHLTDTDKKIIQNNNIIERLLKNFELNDVVKIGLKTILERNNNIISTNTLFKAVEIVDVKRNYNNNNNIEDDCN